MSRTSRKEERRQEILDAYGQCVARYGVEGTTLEKVAEQAGLARALIRHNVGNKEALFEAFLERYMAEISEESRLFFDALPALNRLSTLISWLFDPDYTNAGKVSITNALITAAMDRPALAKQLYNWTQSFIDQIGYELTLAYPDADVSKSRAVATGIAALYFNNDTLAPLKGGATFRQPSETAARLLVATLRQPDLTADRV